MAVHKSSILSLIVIIYFGVAWFFPWDQIQIETTISVSYLWDVLFAILVGSLYKMSIKKGNLKGLAPRLFAILCLAALSILFLNIIAYPVPFRYMEEPFLQLLILAPLLEELVFRYAILGLMQKTFKSTNISLVLSSFLFSLSHLPGIWHLPEEFHVFIIVQLLYTFAMGWVLGKARVRTKGILEPVLLHFAFNLCFYFAIFKEWI